MATGHPVGTHLAASPACLYINAGSLLSVLFGERTLVGVKAASASLPLTATLSL
jgi:hypothetical protein